MSKESALRLEWKDKSPLIIALTWVTAWVALSNHHVFFWDTIQLGSKQAHWFYENGINLKTVILPEIIDSGHPPSFGILLSSVWSIFGRTLPVSHFTMLPFLWGFVFFVWRIARTLRISSSLLLALTLLDPVFLGQSVLVSPDVVLMFCLVLGIYGILQDHGLFKLLAIAGLCVISSRGMMTAFFLWCWEMATKFPAYKNTAIKTFIIRILCIFWPYLPGVLAAIIFLVYHYEVTGWVGHHPGSPWAPTFQRVDTFEGVMRNAFLWLWRLLDFGRVFEWVVLGITVFFYTRGEGKGGWTRKLILLSVLALIIFSITFWRYENIRAHRYLLPFFFSLHLLLSSLIEYLPGFKKRLIALAIFGLATGNFWIYPEKVAQGWDATLAHWPYYKLRQDMFQYLESHKIDLELIGTAFPEIGPLYYKDLSDRKEGFVEKDLEKNEYILYSNVMNDFSDEEIEALYEFWVQERRFERWGVKMILFKRIADG